jgi:hypothetical protein
VFDTNAPVITNSFVNTIDAGPPTSSVTALPATITTPNIPLSWSGSDGAGPGIASYDIFVSTNGGAFVPFLTGTTSTSAVFNGVLGNTYGSTRPGCCRQRQRAPAPSAIPARRR